jgi:hypothetical protein
MLSSAGTLLFGVGYLLRIMLFQFQPFRLEGPIGGTYALCFDSMAVLLLATILIALLSAGRMAEAIGAFLVAPCILSLCFGFACENYLEVDPKAGPLGNSAFMLSELLDFAGSVALLCGPCFSSWRLPSFFLGPVVVFQQALCLYYFLDSLEQAPQSTLSFAAAYEEDEVLIEALPMKGKPEEILITVQSLQFAVALFGMIVYGLRSSPAIANAVSKVVPLLDIGEPVAKPEFYKQTFDV